MEDDTIHEEDNYRPTWKNRRRVIFISLFLCAVCIVYIMLFGADTRVNESIILGAFALSGAVIGSYVFGAVWEDKGNNKPRPKPRPKPTPRYKSVDNPDA